MKKNLAILAACLLFSLSSYAQKYISIQKYLGESITSIVAENNFEVVIRQGEQTGVDLEIDERLEKYLICELNSDQNLTIGLVKTSSSKRNLQKIIDERKKGNKVTITVSSLESIKLDGVTKLRIEGRFATKKCTINGSNTANITIDNIEAESLNIECGNTANIRISGKANQMVLNARNTANITIDNIEAESLNIECGNAANIRISGKANQMVLNARNAANINMDNIEAQSLGVESSNTANIRISGKANQVVLNARNTSKLDLSKLEAIDIRGELSNSRLECHATGKVDLSTHNSSIKNLAVQR